MGARAEKKFLAKLFAHPISARVHYRDLEHAYVYWIWLRGSASYVILQNSCKYFEWCLNLLEVQKVLWATAWELE